jgi:hypothetical protein
MILKPKSKEEKYKLFVIIALISFITFSFLILLKFGIEITIFILISSIALLSFVLIILYLRIQHNIERKYTQNSLELTNEFKNNNEKQIQILEEMNILNNALYKKIENVKQENNDKLEEIKDSISQNINESQQYLKNFEEKLEQENNRRFVEIKDSINKELNKLDQYFTNSNEQLKQDLNTKIKQKFEEFNQILDENVYKKIALQSGNLDKFYWTYVKERRFERLLKEAPDVFKYKTVLYVGARQDRYDFLETFNKNRYEIDVLEIFQPNVDFLKTIPWIKNIIKGDVTDFKTDKRYDVVFWWHGPEHIEKGEIPRALSYLESITNNLIVLGCPWGNVPQGHNLEDKNIYEKHLASFDVGFFEDFGYKADYFGLKDKMGSNIIAVKETKKIYE